MWLRKQKFILSVLKTRSLTPLARWVPSGGSEGEALSSLSPNFQWLSMAFLGLQLYYSNLCLYHHIAFSCVFLYPCVFKQPSCKATSHWIQGCPNIVQLHLHLLIYAKILLPNKAYSQLLRVGTSACLSGEHSSTHNKIHRLLNEILQMHIALQLKFLLRYTTLLLSQKVRQVPTFTLSKRQITGLFFKPQISFTCSRTSYRGNHIVCIQLLSISILLKFIHVIVHMSSLFFLVE